MKNIIYLLIAIIILLGSCTEKIDFELKDGKTNKLVVNGGITTKFEIQRIRLTRTAPYYHNQTAPAELNAVVSVTDGDTVIYYKDLNNDGIYLTETECAGIAGKTYTLNIKLENGEEFTAESKIFTVTLIDSVRYEYSDTIRQFFPNDTTKDYLIYMYAQEKPGKGDHYMWNYYLDNVLQTDTLREKVFVSDSEVDGNYISDWIIFTIPEEEITKELSILKVEILSISKEQLKYYNTIMMETDWKDPMFSGPPANVKSNISNGALGFFYAMDSHSVEIPLYRGQNP